MNKKRFFILLPLLAILLCFTGRVGIVSPVHKQRLRFSKGQNDQSIFVDLNKDQKKIKSNIRTKAWDNSPGITFQYIIIPQKTFFYTTTSAQVVHKVYFPTRYCCELTTRGPPSMA